MDSIEILRAEIRLREQAIELLLGGQEHPTPVTLGDYIVAVLRDAGRPLHYDEIRGHLATRPTTGTKRSVENECSKLVKRGRIVRVRVGVFKVSE